MIGLLGAGLWPEDDEGPTAKAKTAESRVTNANRRLRLQHVRRSPPVTIIVVVGGGGAAVGGSHPRGRSPSLARPPSSSSFATFFFFSVLLGVLHPLPGPRRPLVLRRRQHHLRLLHHLLLRVVSCRAAKGVRQESRTKAGSCWSGDEERLLADASLWMDLPACDHRGARSSTSSFPSLPHCVHLSLSLSLSLSLVCVSARASPTRRSRCADRQD